MNSYVITSDVSLTLHHRKLFIYTAASQKEVKLDSLEILEGANPDVTLARDVTAGGHLFSKELPLKHGGLVSSY